MAGFSMHVEQKSLSFAHIYIFVIYSTFTKYAAVFCCSNQCCPCSYFLSKWVLPWQKNSNKQAKLFVLDNLDACCSILSSNKMEFQLKLTRDSYYDYITHSFPIHIHLDTGPNKTVFCPETERRIVSTVSTPPPSDSPLHQRAHTSTHNKSTTSISFCFSTSHGCLINLPGQMRKCQSLNHQSEVNYGTNQV